MRFVLGAALALSFGVGAYLGSAQVARSAKAPPRTLTMRIGDSAGVGQVRCLAVTDSRSQPILYAYMRCSKAPQGKAEYWVDVLPANIVVWKKGTNGPVYMTSR
jgi:hypothetical protein